MEYAKNDDLKMKKRKAIVDEAGQLYNERTFHDIKMVDIAKNIGVSKGSLFNYFESKETLFLVLLMREYGKWLDQLYLKFVDVDQMDTSDLARILDDTIDRTIQTQPRLFSLVALGHSHLEHNVSLKMATLYRSFINDKVKKIGFEMAKKVNHMSPIKGIKLTMTLHTMLVGHAQLAKLPTIMLGELDVDELENYEIDLRMTLLETLKVYMKGLM